MSLILSLDSTTSVCSVALHRNGKLLDTHYISEPRAASSQLVLSAKNILEGNSIKISQVEAIAISSGPGSYTGLRISTSSAKGLSYALNVPLIAINSLLVLTYPLLSEFASDLYCPMLDARRMEVYCALLNSNLEFVTNIEAKEIGRAHV